MLTALLLLATTSFAVQEAPAGTVPPPPESDDGMVTMEEAVEIAPAQEETAPEVRAFLVDAEKQLYDPTAAGLKSVEFDAVVEVPGLGKVGSVHVAWTADSEATIAFAKDESVTLPPGVPPEILTLSGEQFGRDFLDQMLNRPITPLMADGMAKMEPPVEGMVCISVSRDIERQQRIKEHKLLFNEDGQFQKTKLVVDTTGSGMPFSTLPISEVYTWKASSPGSELLVLDKRVGEQDYGSMIGKETTTTTFGYTTVDSMVVLTSMDVDSQRPPMLGGRDQRASTVSNLVVNGKPATVTPAPAMPATDDAPAAPPAGG